jgi:hypothetical protein
MTLDVCMTAVCRLEIIERTLVSFQEKMFKEYPYRLIINLDPVGRLEEKDAIVKMVDRVTKSRDTLWRFPVEPSFPRAFQWCWRQSRTPYIFHLEDDWELLRVINIIEMLDLMERHSSIAILRLPYTPCSPESNKAWNKLLPWNGEFYEVPEDLRGLLGFAGHPSLICKEFVGLALRQVDGLRNPEKQLKWKPTVRYGRIFQGMRYGVYGKPGDGPAVKDIGGAWREENGWTKGASPAFFTRWERRSA